MTADTARLLGLESSSSTQPQWRRSCLAVCQTPDSSGAFTITSSTAQHHHLKTTNTRLLLRCCCSPLQGFGLTDYAATAEAQTLANDNWGGGVKPTLPSWTIGGITRPAVRMLVQSEITWHMCSACGKAHPEAACIHTL